MGYCTQFELSYRNAENGNQMAENLDEVILQKLHEINPNYFYDGDTCLENVFGDEWKWYDHETDMRTLSEAFPNLIFILEGEGEDQGDVWIKYFYNGRMDVCRATLVFDKPTEDFAKLCR